MQSGKFFLELRSLQKAGPIKVQRSIIIIIINPTKLYMYNLYNNYICISAVSIFSTDVNIQNTFEKK